MKSFWAVIFSGRMLVSLLMGFACGLPLLLTITVLQAWMTDAGIDLSVIGLMALTGLPYTLKFLWAPVFDRYRPPFLGRRRGWLIIVQICLMAAIAALGLTDPAARPWSVAVAALLVTFFSASQDILVDAYRCEDLADAELGLGSSLYVNGYRLGMLLASGGGLIMADHISFKGVYLFMAALMLPAAATTLVCREPPLAAGRPGSLAEAVIAPLTEYFRRRGALWILAFILLYKIGDSMAAAMTIPFYLELGFSRTEVGTVVKLFGFWATIAGSLTGGVMMLRSGIARSLWICGVLQALSTGGFAILARVGPLTPWLAGVVGCENFSSGMGTAAYVAYMASITHKKFTATQYALLSSLMGVPRVMAAAPTGFLADRLGWTLFFTACMLAALPGMLLLPKIAPWRNAS